MAILRSFLMTFRRSGAHVRTVLSLQSQLDLEDSGVSENRRLFDTFLDANKKVSEGVLLCFFVDLGGQRAPTGF